MFNRQKDNQSLLFYLIIFFILIPVLILVIVPIVLVKAFKGNKAPVNYMTENEWQELIVLEEQRRKMVIRVKTLQTILSNDFPNISIPFIDEDDIEMNRSMHLASTLVDKLENQIQVLEQHIYRIETVLDTQLSNWRNTL